MPGEESPVCGQVQTPRAREAEESVMCPGQRHPRAEAALARAGENSSSQEMNVAPWHAEAVTHINPRRAELSVRLGPDNGKPKKNGHPDVGVNAKVTIDTPSTKPGRGQTSQELGLITKETRLSIRHCMSSVSSQPKAGIHKITHAGSLGCSYPSLTLPLLGLLSQHHCLAPL